MEGTIANIIGASFLKFHKFPHNINDIDSVGDLLYGVGGDHGRCLAGKL